MKVKVDCPPTHPPAIYFSAQAIILSNESVDTFEITVTSPRKMGYMEKGKKYMYIFAGLAGFFHLVEETGLNPGLNRPGRNRFLPPEVEETGKNWKKVWNAW